MSQRSVYITTPIYYVNARPHIGHAYTTIACDTIARRQRMMGFDTYFLTGTDEHGQKIERAAQAAGKTPQQFTDEVSAEFRALWDRMGLTYDDFIRTTSDRHKQGVQALWRAHPRQRLHLQGHYTGQYCVFDELYVDVSRARRALSGMRAADGDGQEENYFFKLSAFQDKLLELYTEPAGFHPSGNAAQRSDVVRALRPARSFGQPQHIFLGHSGPGRSQARDLCLAGCAGQLHHGARLRIGRHRPSTTSIGPPTCR